MVDITFRTDGDWGVGQGSNLTPAQVDVNFYNLQQAVEYLEANPVQPNEIVNVVQSGSEITFWMTDSTSFTISMPTVAYKGAPVGTDVNDDYEPVLTDGGKYFRVTGGSTDGDTIITIPPNNEVAFAIGVELHFHQASLFPVIFVEGSNTDETVVFNPVDGFNYATRGRGSVVTCKKVATNSWDIFGALEETTA